MSELENCSSDGLERLDADQVAARRATLSAAWHLEGDRLVADWQGADFVAAVALVNRIAEVAEAQGHHPDILIHGWNKVRLELTTHDVGGLSRNDFVLATHLDRLL